MRVISFFRGLGLCALGVWVAQAQTAREIVDATALAYLKLESYQVQATNRTVRLSPLMMGGPAESAPRYTLSSGRYVQYSLKLRKPDDWSLAVQTHATPAPRVSERGRAPTGPTPPAAPEITFNSITRWEGVPPSRGRLQDGQFTAKNLTSFEFTSELRSLLIQKNVRELVLAQFEPPAGGFSNARPFNVVNPELVEDPDGDTSLYKIKGRTSSGDALVVWIEKARFLAVKSVIYTRSSMMGPVFGSTPGSGPGAGQGSPSGSESRFAPRSMFVIHETVYRSQELNRGFSAEDFQLLTPTTLGPINQDAQDWMSQESLLALVGESPSPGQKTEGGAAGTTVANATPSAVPAAPAAVDAQALSLEQMSGIVLIEGDGGTATGFMTKIRDVDFIVTNLHVLEGNKKLKLKTLRGEEIPMLGVFGAVGSDIAIIRIGSGQGDLKLSADVFANSKIGDKVVVVGNRLGGGVATQTAGSIVGVGPTRVEVNANFEPGNSGSPIVNLGTNEVVGVATYSETRRLDVDDRPVSASSSATPAKVEKRWFGYRLDSVAKWEAIDLVKWAAQGDRIEKFRETSEALHAFIRLDFKNARQHPRLTSILDSFDAKYRSSGGNSITAATEVKDLFRVIRTISDDGVKDLTSGDYYDYFRSCLYWENSIPAQLEYRKDIIEVLKKYEANSSLYVSRLRGGS